MEMLFLLLTTGILAEALIFGLTSYTPPDNNIFFHSFALAYIITGLSEITVIDFNRYRYFFGLVFLILILVVGQLLAIYKQDNRSFISSTTNSC